MSESQTDDLVQGESFTRPMGLVSRLQRTDTRLDFVPVLDIVVIAMLVSLLFTRFVILPGVRVDLPVTEMRMQHSQQAVAVLTIGNNGMLFFDGDLYEAESIEKGFGQYVDASAGADLVLLIKAESSLDLQDFFELFSVFFFFVAMISLLAGFPPFSWQQVSVCNEAH